jgi:ABC-2 type transport system ATP-binding protein
MHDDGDDVVVRADRAGKSFRGGLRRRPVVAVADATIDVRRGEMLAFIGPNGAGKSTMLRMLVGLVFPTSGSVELFGRPVREGLTAGRVGYLGERQALYGHLAPEAALELAGALAGLPRAARHRAAEELMARLGLEPARGRPARRLSKGTRQRLALAVALVGQPRLLVLDEPASGLDPLAARDLRALLLEVRASGTTVIQSTHELAEVEATCDRVAVMLGGRLTRVGTPQALGPLADLLAREAAA